MKTPPGPAPAPAAVKPAAEATGDAPSHDSRLALLLETLESLSKSQGQAAAAGFRQALTAWMAGSPDEVVKFLAASPQRDAVLRMAMEGWAKSDPTAASAWLASRQDTPGRDAMAGALAKEVYKDDPNASLQWVSSIKDPAQKLPAAEALGWEFYRRGDTEATEALNRMGLPDSASAPLALAWSGKLTAMAKRNAQNIVSTANAARAAGATIDVTSLDAVVKTMSEGTRGSGQFADSVFQVSAADWTEREKAALLKNMTVAGGEIHIETN